MEPIVAWGAWQDRVGRNQKRCNSFLAAAEGVSSTAEEEETDCHVDCHIVTIVHLSLETLPEDAKLSEAIRVASASHHETKGETKDTKAGLNRRSVHLILGFWSRVGQDWTSTWLSARNHLEFLPEELNLVGDESFGLFVASACELEPDTEGSAGNYVDIAESHCSEVDIVKLYPRAELLVNVVKVSLENLANERWDLRCEPLLSAFNVVPED